jgi:hypothetical protein
LKGKDIAMHQSRIGIHRGVLLCFLVVLEAALDTIEKAAYCPSGNPRIMIASLTVSLSDTGTIRQQPLRLPPQFDS